MTAEAAAVLCTFRVGKRIVTLTIPRLKGGVINQATCEWKPDCPNPSTLTDRERSQWRIGMAEALADYDCPVTVVDANGEPFEI